MDSVHDGGHLRSPKVCCGLQTGEHTLSAVHLLEMLFKDVLKIKQNGGVELENLTK